MKTIKLGKIIIGKDKLVLIAGPCVIEGRKFALNHAKRIKRICAKYKMPLIFKSSFDKANRTSLSSFRGPGIRVGLKILKEIRYTLGIPILSDVHCVRDVELAAGVLDVIQIPAFLCRQTDLLLEAAQTGKIINVKKGQFLAPWDVGEIIKKIESKKNKRILLTERGTSFGYNNLVFDLRNLSIMRKFGYPVIFDATHSVQLPAAGGTASGGQREFVAGYTRAAVAFGCDGLFLEVHEKPQRAPCDGPNMISFNELEKILEGVCKIKETLK
ncbi:MAG: 3-deoxy-8-phosphooctulonate synthase [Candidatus Omnitrophica bacterium]|nr:3-deoxy-8-phosphooctulonate synthase [Candidatus Omnitrophota bacterium]